MMTYLLGGAMPEYPSWRHYFDVVIVAAQKPAFFQERRPLDASATATSCAPPTLPLERGTIYEGGNLHDFERALGVTGDRILYVGDHIYGDILRSKKESAWRTAMIIQEMEAEVRRPRGLRATTIRERASSRSARESSRTSFATTRQRFKDLTRKIEDAHGQGRATASTLARARRPSGSRVKRGGRARSAASSAKSKRRASCSSSADRPALPPVLGLAAQRGEREVELRRPGRGVRVPLHLAGLEFPRLLAAAVLP